MKDLLVMFGEAIKALDDKGKVGGYLVRFQKDSEVDLQGEYFTAKTYLGATDGDGADVLFHHGIPVGKGLESLAEHIFKNPVKTKRDEVGIWAETVLDQADDYEKKVYALIKAGKLGWSSGSTQRVVRKSADGEITRWPIIEASITHTPCEPQNRAFAVKSDEDFLKLFIPKETPALGKGLLTDKLNEEKQNFYRYENALCKAVREVANAAAASSLTGVEVDVAKLIKGIVGDFGSLVEPMLVKQVNDWLKQENRYEFYVKATLLDVTLAEAPLVGQRFDDRLDLVLAASERALDDATDINGMRVKSGRKISKARMTKLKELHGNLGALIKEVDEDTGAGEAAQTSEQKKSIDSAEVAPEADVLSLVANLEHLKFARIKRT